MKKKILIGLSALAITAIAFVNFHFNGNEGKVDATLVSLINSNTAQAEGNREDFCGTGEGCTKYDYPRHYEDFKDK